MVSAQENSSFACTCGFELWLPIARLEVTHLGFYDDARFPGRCLLVLDRHHEDFARLQPDLMVRFVRDAQTAGAAIQRAVGADRINYAILGNAEPHLHFHLIPRIFRNEPRPKQSPWDHPDPVSRLPIERRAEVIRRIVDELQRGP
jgi:diadenosine tetraphosphate (Ap4A) HIT family hydrolase